MANNKKQNSMLLALQAANEWQKRLLTHIINGDIKTSEFDRYQLHKSIEWADNEIQKSYKQNENIK